MFVSFLGLSRSPRHSRAHANETVAKLRCVGTRGAGDVSRVRRAARAVAACASVCDDLFVSSSFCSIVICFFVFSVLSFVFVFAKKVDVFVCGSLLLVGAMLEVRKVFYYILFLLGM